MRRVAGMTPVGLAETIVHHLKSLRDDVAKIAEELNELRREVRSLKGTLSKSADRTKQG